jgi:predicted Fe-Mo cluster-binding NifX family protein
MDDNGLESKVHNHFGSAPLFVIVDMATREVSRVVNSDLHHSHGACSPLKALNGQAVDVIVVGGVGGGALSKLNQAGYRVYKTQGSTVAENLELFEAGRLREFTLLQTCGGHGGGCSH